MAFLRAKAHNPPYPCSKCDDLTECNICRIAIFKSKSQARKYVSNNNITYLFFCDAHAPNWDSHKSIPIYDVATSRFTGEFKDIYEKTIECDEKGNPLK